MNRYSVIGGGIAGLMTAWLLHQRNALDKIYIAPQSKTASAIAAGVINPITGIRFAKTWMADQLFPMAFETYRSIEKQLGISFFQPVSILRIAETITQLNDWSARSESDAFAKYVDADCDISAYTEKVKLEKGGFFIQGAAKIDVGVLMNSLTDFFRKKNFIIDEHYEINSDSERVILCEGIEMMGSKMLLKNPVIPVKGHYLVCDIPELKSEVIIHGKVTVIPQPDGLYRVGSTYQRGELSETSDESQVLLLEQLLRQTIKVPYKLSAVLVGIRPSSPDRRPIIGSIDGQKSIFILNGLGTKGYSLAPYFSLHLTEHILAGKAILDEVNVNRFL